MATEATKTELNYRVKEKISFREKFCYGLGDFASHIIWSSVGAYATYYYTNSLGMAAAAIGTMFLISRILDAFADILMGIIIDRTKSKYGKARPWILWMAIPFGLGAVLLFSVPQSLGPIAKLIYAYITYNIVATVIFTAINQSYGTMSALITDNVKDRTHLGISRMFMAMVCTIGINFVVMPMVNGFGGTPHAWTMTFVILGIVATILFFICFANIKERVGTSVDTANQKEAAPIPVGIALKSLLANKYWVNRVLFNMTITIATATSAVNIYYSAYWLGNEELVGILSLANVVPMVISLGLVTLFATKLGKKNTSLLGVIIMLAGLIIQAVAPASFVMILIGYGVRGFGTGLAVTIVGVMMGDTIDYGEWKTGVRNEALVFSAASFGTKVGGGLGTALLGWCLAWGGFNAKIAVQSQGAMNAILAVFVYVPMVVTVIALVLTIVYDLDKKMPQIIDDLRQRNQASNAVDQSVI